MELRGCIGRIPDTKGVFRTYRVTSVGEHGSDSARSPPPPFSGIRVASGLNSTPELNLANMKAILEQRSVPHRHPPP